MVIKSVIFSSKDCFYHPRRDNIKLDPVPVLLEKSSDDLLVPVVYYCCQAGFVPEYLFGGGKRLRYVPDKQGKKNGQQSRDHRRDKGYV